MSNRAAFKAWFKSSKYVQVVITPEATEFAMLEAWQACAELKEEEIAKLKQERDELAAQVEVMREALDELEGYARNFSVSGVYLSEEIEGRRLLDKAVDAATITGPDALREIQARTLEDAKEEFYGYKNHTSDEMFVDTAIELLDNLAAAKRKGE